jgi:hypothetical protein
MILHVLIAMVAGWIQRHQQQVIAYLQEENRVLKAQLGSQRLRLTDPERHRLATLAYPLGRMRLKEMATLATPDTLMRWYHRLIAQKFDGSSHCAQPGRPPVAEEVERLAVPGPLSSRTQSSGAHSAPIFSGLRWFFGAYSQATLGSP